MTPTILKPAPQQWGYNRSEKRLRSLRCHLSVPCLLCAQVLGCPGLFRYGTPPTVLTTSKPALQQDQWGSQRSCDPHLFHWLLSVLLPPSSQIRRVEAVVAVRVAGCQAQLLNQGRVHIRLVPEPAGLHQLAAVWLCTR